MTDPARRIKQVIVVRNTLNMRKGKVAAQVAHGSMGFLLAAWGGELTAVQREWLAADYAKIVLRCDDDAEFRALYAQAFGAGLTLHMVTDHGLTEFSGQHTETCFAIGPDYAEKIDPITGHLKPL